MGLFDRKKTSFYDSQPYYTIGNSASVLVVGLGNPGKKYAANRHNVGFMALDKYHGSHDFSNWTEKRDLKCLLAEGIVGNTKVYLMKPTTYMNSSGEAVQAVQNFFRLTNADTVVVHDELDVDFGIIRTRSGGGTAGHNGIKSLTNLLGEDFTRIRVGIGPKNPTQIDSADFVLQDFSDSEQKHIPDIVNEVSTIIDERTAGPLAEHSIKVA